MLRPVSYPTRPLDALVVPHACAPFTLNLAPPLYASAALSPRCMAAGTRPSAPQPPPAPLCRRPTLAVTPLARTASFPFLAPTDEAHTLALCPPSGACPNFLAWNESPWQHLTPGLVPCARTCQQAYPTPQAPCIGRVHHQTAQAPPGPHSRRPRAARQRPLAPAEAPLLAELASRPAHGSGWLMMLQLPSMDLCSASVYCVNPAHKEAR